MNLLKIFLEARTNDHQKTSIYDTLKEYTERYDADTYFITFTNIEKVGINPSTEWSTPIGIYCYPLLASWNNYNGDSHPRPMSELFPFAGNAKYVTVLQLKTGTKELYTNKYSKSLYQKDCITLDEIWSKYADEDDTFDDMKSYAEETSYQRHPFTFFYNLTRCISKGIVDYKNTRTNRSTIEYDNLKHGSVKDFKKKYYTIPFRSSGIWNYIIRKCGYDVLIDDNHKSHIDPNELTQAVILNPSVITNKIMYLNNFNKTNLDIESILDSTFDISDKDRLTILMDVDKYSWISSISNFSKSNKIPIHINFKGDVTIGDYLHKSLLKISPSNKDKATFVNCKVFSY